MKSKQNPDFTPQSFPAAAHQSFPNNDSSSNGFQGKNANGTSEAIDVSRALEGGTNPSALALPPGGAGGFSDYEDGTEQGGFSRVLRAFLRRWYYALGLASLILAGGVYYAITAPPVFRATTIIEDTSSSHGPQFNSDLPVLNEMLGSSDKASIQTQVANLSSSWVMQGAQKRLSAPVRHLMDNGSVVDTAVVPQTGTNLISVNVLAHHPKVASELATRICQEYIYQSLQRNREAMKGSLAYAKNQLDTVQLRLSKAQEQLKDYKQNNGTMNLESESEQIVTRLADAQTRLQAIESESAANAVQRQKLRVLLAQTPESKVVPTKIIVSPQLDDMRNKLNGLNLELSTLRSTYTDAYPQVGALKRQIADIEKRIATSRKTQVADWMRIENPVSQQISQKLTELEGEVEASKSRQISLRREVAQATARLQKLPQKELGMSRLMANVASLAAAQQNLDNQYQLLRISEEAKIADARIMQQAETPLVPVAPNRKNVVLYALVLGLIAGLGLTVILDTLDNRIRDEDDAKRAINLPILGSVPLIKVTQENLLLSDDKPSILLEHYRMLRTNISFSGIDSPIKSIVVTSSVPNEGKSTCAANLAAAAALSGEQVILVDCDLRRPTMHKLFGVSNVLGLSNVVMGNATLEEAMQETSIPGLRILTAGPSTPNLFKLISSSAMRSTLQKLADSEGFVVFDTPPALGLADARVISVVADATLLVVSCNEATRQAIVQTKDLLTQSGTYLIGILLNKVSVLGNNDYYRYYSSYLEREEEHFDKALEEPKSSK
ncbi:capsular exopolysaccharide family [Abditibacterium utsteinense]|uniref:non-specific protein-tyrosine kinase n=1 Tax=Abditibacterium utsteinense TaxID=1960156 RepID=A0A2S8SWL9_9BACT|nr:polysaccharide biosynthesis tyrosine autokinase [Abditibacterium utsteinense]PQV65206.1 capsular exopolysaccharide family [Abditibacterium utsteinense]